MAFESPNYTQTPNDLFDSLMAKMEYAELKVTLAVVRGTFGYHRDEFKLSLSKMAEMTGLSENGVIAGAEAAEVRGTIERVTDGRKSTIWRAKTTSASEVELPQQVRQSTSASEGLSGLKKDINKPERKEGADAPARHSSRKPAELMDHPAVILYRQECLNTPSVEARRAIAAAITDCEKWTATLRNFKINKWNVTNIVNLIDAYKNGNGNGRGRAQAIPYEKLTTEMTSEELHAEFIRVNTYD